MGQSSLSTSTADNKSLTIRLLYSGKSSQSVTPGLMTEAKVTSADLHSPSKQHPTHSRAHYRHEEKNGRLNKNLSPKQQILCRGVKSPLHI